MKQLLLALVNLLKVKTIITLTVMFCTAYGFMTGKIETEVFMPIVTLVLTFYFKKDDKGE